MSAALTRPGEVAGMPKLVLRYRTDPACIAALLPPGLDPIDGDAGSTVQIGIYCVPVHGEPEHGVSTRVPATFDGTAGQYCLGIGIDQESAIFVSRETNGQPKFPCEVTFFRLGDRVQARCTHQGRTFLELDGTTTGAPPAPDGGAAGGPPPHVAIGDELVEDEWWIKVSRAVGGGDEPAYDFPPHVVRVHTEGVVVDVEDVLGEVVLHPSPWDPYTDLLPMVGPATAVLVTTRHTGRSIALAGPLDPVGFWPFADTIGGSRWPGERGAPAAVRAPAAAPTAGTGAA